MVVQPVMVPTGSTTVLRSKNGLKTDGMDLLKENICVSTASVMGIPLICVPVQGDVMSVDKSMTFSSILLLLFNVMILLLQPLSLPMSLL